MKKEQIKIRYLKDKVLGGYIDGKPYYEPVWDYVNASKGHVKRFNDAMMLLAGIDGCEKSLMDWLADNMSEKNYVSNNSITRNAFISFFEKHGKKYSEKTVSIAFQRLCASDFLISITRGVFMVNPKYYYAGDDASRIKAIKMVMEFKAGQETTITVEKR